MPAISPAASLRGLSIQIGRTSEALYHTWLELDRPVRTPPVCGCYRKSLVVASPNEVQPAGSLSSFVGSSPGHSNEPNTSALPRKPTWEPTSICVAKGQNPTSRRFAVRSATGSAQEVDQFQWNGWLLIP